MPLYTHAVTLSLLLLFSSFTVPLSAQAFNFNCDRSDHQTLLKIKAEFGNPLVLSSWNPTTNCCTWKGIQCETAGKTLDLNVTGFSFAGPIPPSLGDLPFLSYLTLTNIPGLTGPIPVTLANLKYLHTLTISQTSLSGPIPTFIGRMDQLGLLDLSYNQLSGPIPNIFNAITMGLYSLDLSRNKLTGSIPASMFVGSVSDPILYLSRNQLTGPIPPALGKVGFREIDLSHNSLTGDASFLFGTTKSTQQIDLSWNELEFDVSRVGIPTGLTALDVSHNRIRGSIPRSMAGLKKLVKLDLSYNRLCGRIPRGRFSSASYVQNKCLCGAPLGQCRA